MGNTGGRTGRSVAHTGLWSQRYSQWTGMEEISINTCHLEFTNQSLDSKSIRKKKCKMARAKFVDTQEGSQEANRESHVYFLFFLIVFISLYIFLHYSFFLSSPSTLSYDPHALNLLRSSCIFLLQSKSCL